MIAPTLVRVEIPPDKIAEYLYKLDHWYEVDGAEICDQFSLNRYRKQIKQGHYHKLVFAEGTTREQVIAWYAHAAEIVKWRELALV